MLFFVNLPSGKATEFKLMDLMEAQQRLRKSMRQQSVVQMMRRYLLLKFFVGLLQFVVGIYRQMLWKCICWVFLKEHYFSPFCLIIIRALSMIICLPKSPLFFFFIYFLQVLFWSLLLAGTHCLFHYKIAFASSSCRLFWGREPFDQLCSISECPYCGNINCGLCSDLLLTWPGRLNFQ